MFENIVEWQLLAGSHEFPGPDGGTCLNEAAIVAAGFDYKKVEWVDDCPPCFSRPISAYVIGLNDGMPDYLRQTLLLPFVHRLAGTADSVNNEKRREQFIVVEYVRRILPVFCQSRELAARCRTVNTFEERNQVCRAVREEIALSDGRSVCAQVKGSLVAGQIGRYRGKLPWTFAHETSACFIRMAAFYANSQDEQIYRIACDIIHDAILLGNHQKPSIEETALRLRAVRERIVA